MLGPLYVVFLTLLEFKLFVFKFSFVYNSLRHPNNRRDPEISATSLQNDLRPVREAPGGLVNMAITNLLTRRAIDHSLGRQQLDNRQQRRRQLQQLNRHLVSIHKKAK